MLLKGIEEAKEATQPLAAADMVLVRIAHAADLPTPDEALRALKDGGPARERRRRPPRPRGRWVATARRALRPSGGGAARAEAAPRQAPSSAPPQPAMRLATFDDLVALAGAKRELKLKHALEHSVRVIRFEDGRIEIGAHRRRRPGPRRRAVAPARGMDRPRAG